MSPPHPTSARDSVGLSEENLDDAALLASCARNPDAFAVLYRRHAADLLRWAHPRAGGAEVALDLLAETFAVAYEKRDSYRPDRGAVGAWLQGILRTEIRRLHRKGQVELRAIRRLGVQQLPPDEESIARIDEIVDAEAQRGALAAAIAELTTDDRNVLELRVIRQFAYSDIATRLNCSVPAARVRVHRALGRLTHKLEVQ